MFPVFSGSLPHSFKINKSTSRDFGQMEAVTSISLLPESSHKHRERKPTGPCGDVKIAVRAERVAQDLTYWLVHGDPGNVLSTTDIKKKKKKRKRFSSSKP